MENNTIVFISGKVTGNDKYVEEFNGAQFCLEKLGYKVMSPIMLPDNLEWDVAMNICKELLRASDAVYFIPGWENSRGSKQERKWAEDWGIPILPDPKY